MTLTDKQTEELQSLAWDAISDPEAPQELRNLAWNYIYNDEWLPFYAVLEKAYNKEN